MVDLAGRAVLPGFVDPHAHPFWEGLVAARPSLRGARDLRSAMQALPTVTQQLAPDAWLVAQYDHGRWPEGRHPTRADLDRAVPDRPVVLCHVSGHAIVANSLALAMAGMGPTTGDLPGDAVLLRDERGEPTGLVEGPGAWAAISSAMPPPAPGEADTALRLAAARLAGHGVTWVTDADVGASVGLEAEMAAYGAAVISGSFPLGLGLMPGLVLLAPRADADPPPVGEIAALLPPGARDRIRLDRAKLYADGALTTRTAWLGAPYADQPGEAGRPAHEPAELAERVRRARRAGWGVATHAIGDAAIAAVLDACEAAAGEAAAGDGEAGTTGNRIEHAMLLTGPLVERLARLAARGDLDAVVVQPEFTAWAGATYRSRLGERMADLLPYARLLAAGIPMAFSSDRPVVAGAPLDGIRAALRHASSMGEGASAPRGDPSISVAEALHAWTAAAARAAGAPDVGVLAAGRPADLVILSGDPTAIPARAWASGEDGIVVTATLVGGRLVAGGVEGIVAEPLASERPSPRPSDRPSNRPPARRIAGRRGGPGGQRPTSRPRGRR